MQGEYLLVLSWLIPPSPCIPRNLKLKGDDGMTIEATYHGTIDECTTRGFDIDFSKSGMWLIDISKTGKLGKKIKSAIPDFGQGTKVKVTIKVEKC